MLREGVSHKGWVGQSGFARPAPEWRQLCRDSKVTAPADPAPQTGALAPPRKQVPWPRPANSYPDALQVHFFYFYPYETQTCKKPGVGRGRLIPPHSTPPPSIWSHEVLKEYDECNSATFTLRRSSRPNTYFRLTRSLSANKLFWKWFPGRCLLP